MNKPIILPKSAIFAGDFHLDHLQPFIWNARGFKSVEEHADFIVSEVASYYKANPDAVMVYLGDGFLNSTVERAIAYFAKLAIPMYYIWGNHEGPTSQIYKKEVYDYFNDDSIQVYPLRPAVARNILFLGREAEFSVDRQRIHASHFAKEVWDKGHHGVWHIFGHSHHSLASGHRQYLEAKKLDIGVDSCIDYFKKPYMTYAQLKDIMDTKKVVPVDHHNRNTT